MEKKVYMVAALAFLAVALASFGVYARGKMEKSQSLSWCDTTGLAGAIVKNSSGDVIGTLSWIEDDGGQSFAIINHGPYYGEASGYTPVPIGALKIAKPNKEEQSNHLKAVVLEKTEKQLEAAPIWDLTKMDDPKYEAKIDKFFGVQPSVCG